MARTCYRAALLALANSGKTPSSAAGVFDVMEGPVRAVMRVLVEFIGAVRRSALSTASDPHALQRP